MTNNREIKFRAWDGEHKEFVVRLTVHVATLTIKDLLDKRNGSWDDYEFSQFTGLLDRHGNEIYEGDIIRNYRSHEDVKKQIVEWYRGGFMLKTHGNFGHSSIELYDGDSDKHYEIIGNIYETEHLLNSNDDTI